MAISIIKIDGKEYQLGASASNVAFNNTGTGIQAGTVQRAIEEVKLTAGSGITINDGVISATGGGDDSQDVSGKADLINLVQGGDMLAVDQWPRTVVYNVTYADMDHLSVGDIYFEISNNRLYYHGQTEDIDLGSPSSTTAYLCSADNMFYRWNGTAFVDAGLQPSEGMTDASLRRNIQIVQSNVDALRASLANSAFSTGRPTMQQLDWDTTQVFNVRLVPVLENCEIVSPTTTEFTVAPGANIDIYINPSSGFSLSTTIVLVRESGRPIDTTITTLGETKIVTITNVQRDMVLTIQAKASAMSTEQTTHSVSLVDSTSKLSLSTDTVDDGTTLVVTLSVTDSNYELPTDVTVTDSNGNPLDFTYDYNTGTITVVNVTDDVIITATAVLKSSHTITVTAPTHLLVYDKDGELQEDFTTGTFTVYEGDDFDLFLIPEEGYKVTSVTASMVYGDLADSVNIQGVYNYSTGKLHISADKIINNIRVSATVAALSSYTLTQTLTGCTSSSEATALAENSELYIVLTPDDGKSFGGDGAGVTVTMGTETITTKAWDSITNTVSIKKVLGDVVITATAVSASNHTVTYTLTDVTKSSGATSVADGSSLTAVLAKGSEFDGFYGVTGRETNTKVYGFAKRDVLVFMGDAQLVEGTDFTMTQAVFDGNVTINIPSVTGDVTIMNIVWKEKYLDAEGMEEDSGTACIPSVKIPIPSGCAKVEVMPNFGSSQPYYTCLYNGSTFVSSHKPLAYVVKEITITSGVDGIVPSMFSQGTMMDAYGYGTTPSGTIPDADGLNYCYVYDITNGKFIWKGDNVTGLVSRVPVGEAQMINNNSISHNNEESNTRP